MYYRWFSQNQGILIKSLNVIPIFGHRTVRLCIIKDQLYLYKKITQNNTQRGEARSCAANNPLATSILISILFFNFITHSQYYMPLLSLILSELITFMFYCSFQSTKYRQNLPYERALGMFNYTQVCLRSNSNFFNFCCCMYSF